MSSRRENIRDQAKLIMETHNGRANFNLGEAAKIIGSSQCRIVQILRDAGVSITTRGKNKMVTAMGLAECIYHRQISPTDNRYPTVGKAGGNGL